MHLYTRQQGYPMVQVKLLNSEENNYTIRLEQKRFFSNGKEPNKDEDLEWQIPININTGKDKRWVYMNSRKMEVDLDIKEFSFIHINSGATGFFRTQYSKELLKPLLKAVEKGQLSESDRFLILSDLKAAFISGKATAEDFLSALKVYSNEENQVVWSIIISGLLKVRDIVRKTDAEQNLNNFVIEMTNKIAISLGNEPADNEDVLKKKLRAQILSLRALCKEDNALNLFKEKYDSFVQNGTEINSDIYPYVLRNAIENGDEKDFERIEKIAKTQNDPMKKNAALSSLGASKDVEILKKALQLVINGQVRKQDTFYIFLAVSSNIYGTDVAWSFFKKNYDDLRKQIESDSLFSTFIRAVGNLRSDEAVVGAEEFFKTKDTKGYVKKLDQALEAARMNIALKKREFDNISKWLLKNN